jgi:hypothetical protein
MTVFQQDEGDSPVLKAESSHKRMLQFNVFPLRSIGNHNVNASHCYTEVIYIYL